MLAHTKSARPYNRYLRYNTKADEAVRRPKTIATFPANDASRFSSTVGTAVTVRAEGAKFELRLILLRERRWHYAEGDSALRPCRVGRPFTARTATISYRSMTCVIHHLSRA